MVVHNRLWLGLFAVCLSSLIVCGASAEPRRGAKREPQKLHLKGKVYAVKRGFIAVLGADNNQPWVVKMPDNPAAIEVSMEDGVLMIKGERATQGEEQREGFTRLERARGSFMRRFSLPDSADAEAISASSRNGVLEIVIPKHKRVQPRRIQIAS